MLDLFGDHKALIVIHNMGKHCQYCTAWADGLNGVAPVVQRHASIVLSTPDVPEVQTEFRKQRGWTMPMVSVSENSFADDMDFLKNNTDYQPGLSVFVRDEQDQIIRVNSADFGPSDNFGILWHLFDLLPTNPIDSDNW
ncbi:DUF899 family protein [Fundicoccus sp. Sow4_H7]|uniref:DUF899 family protein n=1 Tax=Fundicoccus sp. Sow4_H7 TaxID=3438784 RepID=UPI003F93E6B5